MSESVIFIRNSSLFCPFTGRGKRDVMKIPNGCALNRLALLFSKKGDLTLDLERNSSSVLNKVDPGKNQAQNTRRRKSSCLLETWPLTWSKAMCPDYCSKMAESTPGSVLGCPEWLLSGGGDLHFYHREQFPDSQLSLYLPFIDAKCPEVMGASYYGIADFSFVMMPQ